jgi:hypothetical protein
MLINRFLNAIKCVKERLANTVIILKAWLFIKDLKVVRNTFRDSYS